MILNIKNLLNSNNLLSKKHSISKIFLHYYHEYNLLKCKYIEELKNINLNELKFGVKIIERLCVKNASTINKFMFSFVRDNTKIELNNINNKFKFISIVNSTILAEDVFKKLYTKEFALYKQFVKQNIILSSDKYFYSAEVFNSLSNTWVTISSELMEITDELKGFQITALHIFYQYLPEIIFIIQK